MAKLFSYASDTWFGLLFTIKWQSATFHDESTLRLSPTSEQCGNGGN